MERISLTKSLTSPLKGDIISLYYSGKTYSEISQRLNISVRIFYLEVYFFAGYFGLD